MLPRENLVTALALTALLSACSAPPVSTIVGSDSDAGSTPQRPMRAPWPPFMKNIFTKRRPSGWVPLKYTFHKGEPQSATTRSGSTGASAPKITGGT